MAIDPRCERVDVALDEENPNVVEASVSSPTSINDTRRSTASICGTPDQVGALSVERLERELRRARIMYENAYAKQTSHLPAQSTAEDTNSTQPEDNVSDDQDAIARCVESTNDLSKEMELAKDDMFQASLRAEKFLADLSAAKHDDSDKDSDEAAHDLLTLEKRHEAPSPNSVTGLTTIHSHQETATSNVAPFDIKSLLQDIHELKLHVKAAKDEVADLRSSIHCQQHDSNKSENNTKAHRRINSSSTTRTIPTHVECTVDDSQTTCTGSNGYHHPTHEDVFHTYVDKHLRIADGFTDEPATPEEFDANWWKGGSDNEAERICGREPCVFGGFVKLIRGKDSETTRNILS